MLVTGHGVDHGLAARCVREAAGPSSRCPTRSSSAYAVPVAGRGWLAPGAEANALRRGHRDAAGPQGVLASAPTSPTGDPEVDADWFAPNVWPARGAGAAGAWSTSTWRGCAGWPTSCCALLADALGLRTGPLHPAHGPADLRPEHQLLPAGERRRRARAGPVPHRPAHRLRHGHDPRPRAGRRADCRCIRTPDGWEDAPYDPDALTVNIGDLMECWSGRRWPSGRHRVLPPQPTRPTRIWSRCLLLRGQPRRRRRAAGSRRSGGCRG